MWVGVAISTDTQDTTNCKVQNNKHIRQQCAGTNKYIWGRQKPHEFFTFNGHYN